MPKTKVETPFIYNLFPPLIGESHRWLPHVERAAGMGFDWLFLNPIHLVGESGSLYAIRDYFTFNPAFFPQRNFEEQKKAFREFVRQSNALGVQVMVDLVVNHTSYDNPLTREHRNWYLSDDDGSIKSPGAADDTAPGGYVTWGDLSEIDNINSPDKKNLYEYWWSMVNMFLDLGVTGFRCDAAYQVPTELWKLLISRSLEKVPEAKFFAESLGCPMEDTLRLTDAGFNYTFNSGKWWNYKDDWFLDQLRQLDGRGASICFPESHDTERLATEWNGDEARIRQHYLFTALISGGVMISMGFEFGFRKKPHVVHTQPSDFEEAHYDLTDFIREVNEIKKANQVFQEDNRVEKLDVGNGNVLAIRKTSSDGKDAALLLFGLHGGEERVEVSVVLRALGAPRLAPLDLPGSPSDPGMIRLGPWGVAILAL